MKTTTVFKALTALAALAAAACAYSTLPEGRALTEAERMMGRGLGDVQGTATRTPCRKPKYGGGEQYSACTAPTATPDPSQGASIFFTCDGMPGVGVEYSSSSDAWTGQYVICTQFKYEIDYKDGKPYWKPAGSSDNGLCNNRSVAADAGSHVGEPCSPPPNGE